MSLQFLIDDVDYTADFLDGNIAMNANFKNTFATLKFIDDVDDTLIKSVVEFKTDIKIYETSVLKFRGLIQDVDPSEEKEITLYCPDYSFHLSKKGIDAYNASNQTASTIVSDLVTTYGDGIVIESSSIATTTRTYDRIWRGYTPMEIIQWLAIQEIHNTWVDKDRVLWFQPHGYNDLGVTLTDGEEIDSYNFPIIGNKVRNRVLVIGRGAQPDSSGIAELVRDSVSMGDYEEHYMRHEDNTIITSDQAIEVGNEILLRLANPTQPGEASLEPDWNYAQGDILRLTIPQHDFVAKQFVILGLIQELENQQTHVSLVNFTDYNSESIANLFADMRNIKQRFQDIATPISSNEQWYEEIVMEVFATVEKQSIRRWNEGKWNTGAVWNEQSPIWTTEIDDEQMVITTLGLQRARDRYIGIASDPMDAATARIAFGDGTTPATVGDTALENEIIRKDMDSGFPRVGTGAAESEHQVSMDDSDIVDDTFNELGILDDDPAGELLARVVTASAFNKSADSQLRARMRTNFKQV
jgi:hypothetical protein